VSPTTATAPRHPAPTMKLETPCREWRGARLKGKYGGYGTMCRSGKKVYVHRWVVEQVEGRTLASTEIVRHRCDNPPCFRYDHLIVGTTRDNTLDSIERGRAGYRVHLGEANGGGGKLTEDQAREIKHRYPPGPLPPGARGALAAEFGVSYSLIGQIRGGKQWRHV